MARNAANMVLAGLMAVLLAACATTPAQIATLPGAISVPYELSETGLFVVDVGVNGGPPRPFFVDSGASTSAIYDRNLSAFGLSETGESVVVRGLVSTGERPKVEGVTFTIGALTTPVQSIVSLKPSTASFDVVGLIGLDVLSDYLVMFDVETKLATFIPASSVSPRSFVGWRLTELQEGARGYPNLGLHFADLRVGTEEYLALIDTGSDTSIINWPLALKNGKMRRIRRDLRQEWEIQGAIGTFSPRASVDLGGVVLGRNYWPQVNVVVMDMDNLSTIAPTDQPMMIAGSNLFRERTVAFDFANDAIYILPLPNDPRPPSVDPIYVVGDVSEVQREIRSSRD
ncbi:hypothetical protein HK107_10930 [Parvularcula sp. ZS-1/3]|uniref:Peptidase A2 domain-containing protein n=1 Tax=Parvularcula mediterranea TaxID=2732508 RepID=A0A7Y3RMH4_9PROT|nr:aspartyl protease family protein [Parvularcula mediterranea]NNU16831.1 hypothetical protein [Parvularcula mediterranea]